MAYSSVRLCCARTEGLVRELKILIGALVLLGAAVPLCGGVLPDRVIPDSIGVNIHFTGREDEHVTRIAEAGLKFIRMDIWWSVVETTKGSYDFTAHDQLVDSLAERGIRPVFILCYGNPLYDGGDAPHTDEGRAAFARYAAACAAHFRGKGVIWELWNEPNGAHFWRPAPNAEDYISLAKVVYPAVRKADPNAFMMGPALAGPGFDYLEDLLKRGLLDYVDALSVHPYGSVRPEDAYRYYETCRGLLRKYGPKDRELPIVSGEWGFSAVKGITVDMQGQYLARKFLVNLANGIALSIWYDWIDDGPDPEEKEHHFGILFLDGSEKPSYKAVQTLTAELAGYRFTARLDSADEDHLLLFTNGSRTCLAAWTTGAPHKITLPVDVDGFTSVGLLGERTELQAKKGWLEMELSGSVQYVRHDGVSARWMIESSWSPGVQETSDEDGPKLTITSHIDVKGVSYDFYSGRKKLAARQTGSTFSVPYVPDGSETGRIRIVAHVPGLRQSMTRTLTFANQLAPIVRVVPPSPDIFRVAVSLPRTWTNGPFHGMLSVRDRKGIGLASGAWVMPLRAGEHRVVDIPITEKPAGLFSCSIELTDRSGRVVARTPAKRYSVVETFSQGKPGETIPSYDISLGESKVPGEARLTYAYSPEWGPWPVCGKISYRFDPGWQWVQVTPASAMTLPGRPTSASIWIKGQKNGSAALVRFRGADGQTFNTRYGTLDTRQWEILTADFVNGRTTHWGGRNDGIVRLPLTLESLVVIENQSKQAITGEVLIGPVLLCYD